MGYPSTTFSTTPQPTNPFTQKGTPLGAIGGLFTGGSSTPQSYTNPNLGGYMASQGIGTQKPLTGLLNNTPQHAQPTTPLASITTNPDGTAKTTYHKPIVNDGDQSAFSGGNSQPKIGVSSPQALQNAGMNPAPTPSYYDTTTGFLTPAGKSAGMKAVQPGDPSAPSAPASTTVPGTNGNNGTNFQQNLGNVQSTGNQTSNENTTLTGLIEQSQQPSDAYNTAMANYTAAKQALADFEGQLQDTDTNIQRQGISLDSSRGQQAVTAQNVSGHEAALQEAITASSNVLGAANTQQGLEVQAGTAANSAAQTTAQRNLAAQGDVAGLTQPQQVSPGNTLVSPATDQVQYGLGTGAGGNGADAYQNFSNLKFNTEAGQNFSQQANSLQTAANQTDQNFVTLQQAAAGINLSSFPSINAASQFLQTQAGGAGKVSALNEAYNALQTSMASIINSGGGGLTPTQITSLTNGQNISSLSPAQLMTLYNTVQQTMKTKISTTQQQAIQAEQAGTGFNNGSSTNSSNPYEDMVQ